MAKSVCFVLFQTCVGLVYCMDTYYMTNYCGSEINMNSEGINTGRLELDASYMGDCNVTIGAWLTTTDRLMFYFEDMSIPEYSMSCEDTFFEVYNGQPPNTGPFYGIPRLCGSDAPSGDFVSGRYLTFRFVNKGSPSYASLRLIFTAFHRGHCYSYEYRCGNGRCIDDSVNCNGFNPCGDNSDCQLSDAAIVGIVVGALFGLAVILTISCVVYKQRRARHSTEIPAQTASPFDASPAALLHSVPPPSYGASNQYTPPPRVYGVATNIQGDDKTN